MPNDIELIDQKRKSFLKGYIVGFGIFIVLWIIRFFFRASDLNVQPIGLVVLAGLIISVIIQAFYMIKLSILSRNIRNDNNLKEALYNELVQFHELRSWKAAFFCAIGSTVFFALMSFVYPVQDLVLVALTAIMVGAGAYRIAFYVMDR